MLAPIVEILCDIDDFCKEWFQESSAYLLTSPHRRRRRSCRMSASELMTLVILFHLSHYRKFKDYYQDCAERYEELFPKVGELQPIYRNYVQHPHSISGLFSLTIG
ncbi:MAG: hypothetical protein BGO90_14520 [Legionella sp. 40-6]|nr:hypothetical protein [Legionella sp.]OJY07699.1 MAG: hypothetical protein BGO90_14520 [Legionella sp. 40-6]